MTGPSTTRPAGADNELVEFLRSRRWFGDKAREIRDARLRDVIPVEWPNSAKPFAVARVDITTDAGTSTYQIFLERGVRLADALDDPGFLRGLADGFAANLTFEAEGARWIFESAGKQAFVAPPDARISLSTAEQSNSSVIIDRSAILKLFRRLEPGVHPDVEVTRFLTLERQFVNVPVLLGTIRFEDREGTTTAGMLQELVPSAMDGWSYALEQTKDYFAGGATPEPLPFGNDARQLGRITRALHDTLASGDAGSAFDMRPVTDEDLQRWVRQAGAMIERATASLSRTHASGARGELTQRVIERAPRIRDGIAAMIDDIGRDRGSTARTHGDYHLGQVIRSRAGGRAGDFLVIDFEGEPARPLHERRAHQSPLRDVAGMLRSFAYAAAVASRDTGSGAERRRVDWERTIREAFLTGYFGQTEGPARLLPTSRENAERIIALFETEKVFYELQYELDHRPDWTWIPLRGIEALRA
jgi:maltose alpha-D-glucosyltransferase/alpha-amylase